MIKDTADGDTCEPEKNNKQAIHNSTHNFPKKLEIETKSPQLSQKPEYIKNQEELPKISLKTEENKNSDNKPKGIFKLFKNIFKP